MWLKQRIQSNQTLKPLLRVWASPSSWNAKFAYVVFCGIGVTLSARHMFMLLEIERYTRNERLTYPYETEHLDLLLACVSRSLPDECQLPEVIAHLAECARREASKAGIDDSLAGDSLVEALGKWVSTHASDGSSTSFLE